MNPLDHYLPCKQDQGAPSTPRLESHFSMSSLLPSTPPIVSYFDHGSTPCILSESMQIPSVVTSSLDHGFSKPSVAMHHGFQKGQDVSISMMDQMLLASPMAPSSLTNHMKRRLSVGKAELAHHEKWACRHCHLKLGRISISKDSFIHLDALCIDFLCINCSKLPHSHTQTRCIPVTCSQCKYAYGCGFIGIDASQSLNQLVTLLCYPCMNEISLGESPTKIQKLAIKPPPLSVCLTASSPLSSISPSLSHQDLEIASPASSMDDLHSIHPSTKLKPKRWDMLLEKNYPCSFCEDPGILINYFGTKEQVDGHHSVRYACTACSPSVDHVPEGMHSMSCNVCKKFKGAISVQTQSSSGNTIDLYPPKRRKQSSDVSGPQAHPLIEMVCASCQVKYRNCSECGGGGRVRTGKFRPVELFYEARKTCRLSHIRIGAHVKDFEYIVAPNSHTFAELRDQLQSVHEDGLWGLSAQPEIMEDTHSGCQSFDDLKASIYDSFQNLITKMTTSDSLRCMAIGYSPISSKKLVRAANNASIVFESQSCQKNKPLDLKDAKKTIMGYALLEWKPDTCVLELQDVVLRAYNPLSTLYQDLLWILVQKAMSDHRVPSNATIKTRIRREHSRLIAQAQRAGFGQQNSSKEPFTELSMSLASFLSQIDERLSVVAKKVLETQGLDGYLNFKRMKNAPI